MYLLCAAGNPQQAYATFAVGGYNAVMLAPRNKLFFLLADDISPAAAILPWFIGLGLLVSTVCHIYTGAGHIGGPIGLYALLIGNKVVYLTSKNNPWSF